ncbi:aminoacyl--tRNA ligase-related protein [Halolamina sp. C58]|uniref:aminoacyl--tRNA ligase-related protein n=1 Tax=Halolamina sp. C58 TaxID=3421640 RepID=UPI003EB6DE39
MRRSDLFLPASRERRGEGTAATERLVRAGLIREFGSGLWGLTPAGKRVREKVVDRIRTGMDAVGGQEVSLPGLQQRERWEQSGRWGAFEGEMFTLADRDGRDLCLAPSHEEGMVHLLDGLVRSYDDLPLTLYQDGAKFRDDRARAGLLRCKEFTMKDAYSFHGDEASLREGYREIRTAYERILSDLGLSFVIADAANSVMGGDRSEEFLAPVRDGTCDLLACSGDGCRFGLSDESPQYGAFADGDDCPDCGDRLRESGGVEVGHVFELGTGYAESMGFTVDGADGRPREVHMGSYGLGIGRIVQTMVMQGGTDSDSGDAGCYWPVTEWGSVAPYRAAVIPIGDGEVETVAAEIHDELGADCLLFDGEQSVGERFAESDLLGLPGKIVVGNHYRETGEVEIEDRNGESSSVAPEAAAAAVERFGAGG